MVRIRENQFTACRWTWVYADCALAWSMSIADLKCCFSLSRELQTRLYILSRQASHFEGALAGTVAEWLLDLCWCIIMH